MDVTLKQTPTFMLTINGVVFDGMKQTGELDGIRELSNGKTSVTLMKKGPGVFSSSINAFFNGGIENDWIPIRGTPDINKAVNLVK